MKKLFLLMAVSALLFSCGDKNVDPDQPGTGTAITALSFNTAETTIERSRGTAKLGIKITPANADLSNLVFTSSADTVATVDNRGNIMADTTVIYSPTSMGGVGTTTITASVKGTDIKATTTVHVKDFYDIVDINNSWTGWFTTKTKGVKNPQHNPEITYTEAMEDPELSKTYPDSIQSLGIMIATNGLQYVGGEEFVAGSPSAYYIMVELAVAFRSKSSCTRPDDVNVLFALNGDEDGYEVNPNWIGDDCEDLIPRTVRPGTIDHDMLRAYFNGEITNYQEAFAGSMATHNLEGGYYSPLETGALVESFIQLGFEDEAQQVPTMGRCEISLEVAEIDVENTTDEELAFYNRKLTFHKGTVGNIEGKAASMATRTIPMEKVMTKMMLDKSMNIALMSKLSLTMPELVK